MDPNGHLSAASSPPQLNGTSRNESPPNGFHLLPPPMERSTSTNTTKFRSNYDSLLKEVLEENSEDDSEDLLSSFDIDMSAATADLPDELRAALEDRSLADKYLANLKTFMSHRRTHSIGSTTSGKGDYSTPGTPMQPTFSHHRHNAHHYHNQPLSPNPFFHVTHDPLSKILDAVPYHTRLVNGVQSLTVLEQKFQGLRIPELDLPTISDTIIRSRLDDMYKIQDELYIHLHGGPLVKNTSMSHNIGEKKKQKILSLLDDIAQEIGLYEEFVKRANYLNLDNILNDFEDELPQDDQTSETHTSVAHFDSSSDLSRATPGTPGSPITLASTPVGVSPGTPRRPPSSATLASSTDARPVNSALLRSRLESDQSTSSRQSSDVGSSVSDRSPSVSILLNEDEPQDEASDASEAFKWTPLKKISDQLYSNDVRKHSGLASVLAVSGVIAIGTTRGLVFVYDYSQNLKCILGDNARALEIGSVTSLAISADHTTVACGHSQGYILVWDIRKPASPVRVIDPIPASQASNASVLQQQSTLRKEGHVKGASILHIGFVGVKKSDIVSGDDQGMAFYHVLYKVVMVNAVDTTRILGRYQNLSFPALEHEARADAVDATTAAAAAAGAPASPAPPLKPRRPSTVFAMQPLPLGQVAHPAENFGLVALLTPYKMIIVGLKPTTETQYKFLKPKLAPLTSSATDNDGHENASDKQPRESLAGCLAWLPVTRANAAPSETASPKDRKSKNAVMPATDPMLAFSWSNRLYILTVMAEATDPTQTRSRRMSRNSVGSKNTKRGTKLEYVEYGEWKCQDVIVGLQWINRQILLLTTPNEDMILLDPKTMTARDPFSIRSKELVYHDRFHASLHDLLNEPASVVQTHVPTHHALVPTFKSIEMAYYHSLRSYKGKLFLLGLNKIYIGTLLSWADCIIALVKAGNFLKAIEQATLFYNGQKLQTVVGLPEDEGARKQMVGEKLMELLVASLNYALASNRLYDDADELNESEATLLSKLAKQCVDACLSMDRLDFLFDTVYERFVDARVRGIFLEVLEPYILQETTSRLPPDVMKDLVDHYCQKRLLDRLEHIIWHVAPESLDIDQIVSMCHREGLYEAMMYVWNSSMHDYVSPVVEMLKVIRAVLKEEATRLVVPQEDYYYNDHAPRSRMASSADAPAVEEREDTSPISRKSADKLFDYLRFILIGRTFPDGVPMQTKEANEARSAVYSFVFSGRCVVWPPAGGQLVLTAEDGDQMSEPTYPYLRLLLRFSTKKFLDALETAFTDPWLNGGDDILTSTFEEEVPGKIISRQIIVNTLLDVMGGGLSGNGLPPPRPKQSISTSTVQSFTQTSVRPPNDDNDSLVQLYVFIASNLHKYTTFILLPPTTLHKILVRLAEEHDPDTRQERQTAVSKLLTVYTPINEEQMILYYEEAGFWQVLEEVYRRDKKYGKLVETYLKDNKRRSMVFECVYKLLGGMISLTDKQTNEVRNVFMIRISQFVEIDGQKSAQVVQDFFKGDHEEAIRRLEEDHEFDDEEYHDTADKRVFLYLRGLLEPFDETTQEVGAPTPIASESMHAALQEKYIELSSRYDPSGVYNYLNTRLVSGVDLKKVLKSCEDHGVMDAVVWIMEKSGDTLGALDTMLGVAKEKVALILDIVKSHTDEERAWTFEEQRIISSCLVGLSGVLRVGTRLCENSSRHTDLPADVTDATDAYDEIESLWFRLLDMYVESSIEVYNVLGKTSNIQHGLHQHILSSFKSFVQSILTSLLLSTSPQVSLPRLLLRLIESQARGETTFADFRDIFLSMLDTYKYEGKLLEMTNRLFDRDLFSSMQSMVRGKGRGWRPRRGACDVCGASVLDLTLLQEPLAWNLDEGANATSEKEDGDKDNKDAEEGQPAQEPELPNVPSDVVVFQCGHVFHKRCMKPDETICPMCQTGKATTKKENGKGKERAA